MGKVIFRDFLKKKDFIATPGQTIFDVIDAIEIYELTEFLINGVSYQYGSCFTVDTLPNIVKYTWDQFTFQGGETVTIKYYAKV